MAHVEFEITESPLPPRRKPTKQLSPRTPEPEPVDSFQLWTATVARAAEPCLVIDRATSITAVSVSCCDLLGLRSPADTVGLALLDGGLHLVDFTAASTELTEAEADKIPPLLAMASGRLARGLLRVRSSESAQSIATVDAIATPLSVDGKVAGSLTFFSAV